MPNTYSEWAHFHVRCDEALRDAIFALKMEHIKAGVVTDSGGCGPRTDGNRTVIRGQFFVAFRYEVNEMVAIAQMRDLLEQHRAITVKR